MKNYDDYKDRIRYLISRLYEPADVNNFDVKMTTSMIFNNLCSIIPANAFDEFVLVELLEEMGFEPGYEQKKKVTEDSKGNKLEIIYDDLVYYWYLKKL